MYCPHCGAKLSDHDERCAVCGSVASGSEAYNPFSFGSQTQASTNYGKYSYEVPEIPGSFGRALAVCFLKYCTFRGRASRTEYWCWIVFQALLHLFLTSFNAVMSNLNSILWLVVASLLQYLFVLALFLPTMAVSVRRLHDTGRSGQWLLAALIPVVGVVMLFVFFLLPSRRGQNRFGEEPQRR